jgi:phenylalanyl-tRNA synthetase beta chain
MRVPVSWLRDYVAMDMPLGELASRFSVTTAEIEDVEAHGVVDADGNLGLFKVGKVVEAEKHPNADRRQIIGPLRIDAAVARDLPHVATGV